jgi:hypothetical protein
MSARYELYDIGKLERQNGVGASIVAAARTAGFSMPANSRVALESEGSSGICSSARTAAIGELTSKARARRFCGRGIERAEPKSRHHFENHHWLEQGVTRGIQPGNAERAAGNITRPLCHNGQACSGINTRLAIAFTDSVGCSSCLGGVGPPASLRFRRAQ